MPRRKKDKPAEVEESFHALNARMEKRLLREHLEQQEKKAERKRKR